MTELLGLLSVVSNLSPLAVIALLGIIIFLLVKGKTSADAKINSVADNHLHELPIIVENSRKTVEILQRIEVRLGEDLTWIKAKVSE